MNERRNKTRAEYIDDDGIWACTSLMFCNAVLNINIYICNAIEYKY